MNSKVSCIEFAFSRKLNLKFQAGGWGDTPWVEVFGILLTISGKFPDPGQSGKNLK